MLLTNSCGQSGSLIQASCIHSIVQELQALIPDTGGQLAVIAALSFLHPCSESILKHVSRIPQVCLGDQEGYFFLLGQIGRDPEGLSMSLETWRHRVRLGTLILGDI